jgi:hypothetical protein
LDAQISQLQRDLPDAETRVKNLELSSRETLEANNVMLTPSIGLLQSRNQMLADQLGASLNNIFPRMTSPLLGPSPTSVVLAICKELEGTITKGKILLNERDLIKKADLNHPGEPTITYTLRHTIPNFFLSKGTANSWLTTLQYTQILDNSL